jgi:flagellar biosynthetic protein FlhB
VAGIMANLIQSGPVFSAFPLQPTFDKIDPFKGAQRILSRRALVRLVANLAKLGAIVWISYAAITGDYERIVALSGMSVGEIVTRGADVVLGLGLKLAAIFIVLAILDYMYQRWQYQQDLRMTKQELREEMKRMEGDPLIREQRRHIQRQLAMQRMAAEVPKADAVIANPTHYAIAIRYDSDQMAAPRVVAKGQDFMARRIRELALEHGVPIIERPALARALYRAVQVGQEIPLEFYRAVAEVLAFVYRLTHKEFRPTVA